MFDIELKNCPERYALNCKRYETHCHECKANGTSKYNKYLPIDKSMLPHPADVEQKKKSRQAPSYARKGRSDEKKIIGKVWWLNSTVGSGMVSGDGDAYIDLEFLPRIRTEIKIRYTENGSKAPSKAEIKEGLTQGVSVWYIYHKAKRCTYIYMTYKFFCTLQSAILMSPNFECETELGPRDRITTVCNAKYRQRDKVNRWEQDLYHKTVKGTMPNIPYGGGLGINIYILTTSIGRYVMMTEGKFDDMLYQYGRACAGI